MKSGTARVPTPTSPPPPLALVPGWRVKFLLLALVWGASFLLIKIGTEALAPLQITLGRMVFGAIPLAIVLVLSRGRLPGSPRIWIHLSVAAFLLNVVPFTLFGYAARLIPSALAGICNSATPLFALMFSLVLLSDEKPTRGRLIGLATGFGGVLVVFAVWTGFAGAGTAGMLLAVGAALCYGLGTPYLRRFLAGSRYSPLELSAGQLIAGSAQLAVITPLVTDAPAELPPRVVLAVVALGALGTGLAYVLQYAIVREAGATVASTVTYVVPVVAIALGVLVAGEALTWNQPVGAAIIIVGAALCHGSLRSPRRSASAPDRN
ncbi:drug/metabolite transporter (DMT)-like permease [Lipingzhangella halophila]|uniref:Drug/metabolite transporter (DMT)-like permease n=1 Tax=Lipingzhangella halophila TaxID=1783352 RepID=A0A7W7RFE6_9ACTN|nr:DMT family transporter [Lipingzhangella halophila]MBB4930966.1 drug/metabolite transporter (DMT)-like permease [Lipingzhangella halophila]